MENHLTARTLAASLKRLCAVISKRVTIPILANVLLEATGDALTLTTTDLDSWLTETLAAPGVGVWSTTAPAHDLRGLAAKAGGADVSFEPAERLIFAAGDLAAKLATITAADFPRAPEIIAAASMLVCPVQLAEHLAAVAPCIGKHTAGRWGLEGAHLAPTAGGAHVVATDGDRLAVRDLEASADGEWPAVTLPAALAAWLAKHMDRDGLATVTVGKIGERVPAVSITTEHGAQVLAAKCLDFTFPDYTRLMGERPAGVAVDVGALRAALAFVAIAHAPAKSRPALLTLEGGEIRAYAAGWEMDGETWLEGTPEPGAVLDVAVDAARLGGILQALPKGSRATLARGTDGRTLVIDCNGAESVLALLDDAAAERLRTWSPPPPAPEVMQRLAA